MHKLPKYIYHLDDFLKILDTKSNKIVFANGCFDLLHQGHIHLLNQAKHLGDILIVAINTDASIKKLKGESRPIETLDTRIKKIAALSVVDYIIAFDEDTPLQLIQKIKPNIIVKGSDYNASDVVGADIAEQVVIIPLLDDYSTTKIIEKLSSSDLKNT